MHHNRLNHTPDSLRFQVGLGFAMAAHGYANVISFIDSYLGRQLMATAGFTMPGEAQQAEGAASSSVWMQCFSSAEREQLLHDDLVAGTSISVILVVIFVIGLLLSVCAVLMSH
jgi:hypothetical protein